MGKRRQEERKPRLLRLGGNLDISEGAYFQFTSSEESEFIVEVIRKSGESHHLEFNTSEVYYEREGKSDKIVAQQNSNREIGLDLNIEILNYDVLLVIDTSYEIINNVKYAFTGFLICQKTHSIDSEYRFEIITQVIEWDATDIDKPENYMYVDIIEKIKRHNEHMLQNPSVAVIVDSDLINIPDINRRLTPIYFDYILPENFQMFYASSDVGTSEYIQNRLMKICDNEAKIALNEFRSERINDV